MSEHPTILGLERLKVDLAMDFVRAVRDCDHGLRDDLLINIEAVEVVQRIAHQRYDVLTEGNS